MLYPIGDGRGASRRRDADMRLFRALTIVSRCHPHCIVDARVDA